MSKRTLYTATLAILLLGVVTVTSGLWQTGSFSHGEPDFDQGCYCHNNGIAIYVNGTGDGNGGVFFGPFTAGSSFHLYVSTNNVAATGVVPGLQQWQSNQTDNAKFTFSPTSFTANSPYNLSTLPGNITALYKITAPTTPGDYVLTLYSQGTLLMGIAIQVVSTITFTTSTIASTQILPPIATSTDTKPSDSIPGWEYEVLALIALCLGLFISVPLSLGYWWSKHQEPAAKRFKTRTETASFQHAENEPGGRLRGQEPRPSDT